ncbi:MAG: S41 family peptidase [Bdellovibrionota bacterium]
MTLGAIRIKFNLLICLLAILVNAVSSNGQEVEKPASNQLLAQKLAQKLAKTSEREYWNQTGLKFTLLQSEFINEKNCNKSQANFIGCISSLNMLAGSAKPAMMFVTPGLMEQGDPRIGEVKDFFGPLVLVELKKLTKNKDTPKSTAALQLEHMARQKKLIAEFTALYLDPEKTDFTHISESIKKLSITPDNESEFTALAINKYLQVAEDPHTHIVPIIQTMVEQNEDQEIFFGIGTVLRQIDTATIIQRPIEGSPALKAGLKAGDIITHVNSESIDGVDLDIVVGKIRGEKDTEVVITILRKGQSLEFKLIRGPIVTDNVTHKSLKDTDTTYGYIKLDSFSKTSGCNQISQALTELKEQGVEGIILDLRNNGGGFLDEATCIGGLLVGKKVIFKTKYLNSEKLRDSVSDKSAIAESLPMVTLINENSASASEIIAGALQDYQRSWLLGVRSFGKATVQSPSMWNDFIFKYETTERFFQPSGRTNQIVGILPDFEVQIKPDASEDDRFAMREVDYYSNALPAIGAPWVQPRQEEVKNISECMASEGKALKLYQERLEDAIPPDYQLLSAEDLLNCASKTAPSELPLPLDAILE